MRAPIFIGGLPEVLIFLGLWLTVALLVGVPFGHWLRQLEE